VLQGLQPISEQNETSNVSINKYGDETKLEGCRQQAWYAGCRLTARLVDCRPVD
jgi:hypothetical protein